MNYYGRNISPRFDIPFDARCAGNNVYFDNYGNLYLRLEGDPYAHPYRTDFGEIYQLGNIRIHYDDYRCAYEIGGYRVHHRDDNQLIYEINGIRIYYDDYGHPYEIGNCRLRYY